MKKIDYESIWESVFPKTLKLLMVMKLTVFLVLISALSVIASETYSQSKRLTLEMRRATVQDVLSEIEEQSEFYFLYSEKVIDVQRKVTVDFNEQNIETVLNTLFAGTDVTHVVKDRIIVLSSPDIVGDSVFDMMQQSGVTGKVTDAGKQAMPGVTILVKGTSVGTVTDVNGNYNIDAAPNATLVFSFIGMKTQEISVNNQSTINIQMEVDAIGIEEVVAIGYGVQKKRDVTGSVVSVSEEELNLGGTVSNTAQALQGRAAGVQVTQNSSAPGGSISIRIRGANSISSSNEPLYVVDGFPTETGKNINPNDIKSIEILKDASATAIYGARGANGVVLITTKRGEAGKNIIEYDTYFGAQKITNKIPLLSSVEHMEISNTIASEEGLPPVYTQQQMSNYAETDWQDEALRVGLVNRHDFRVSGGDKDTKIALSLNYFDQEGILKTTDFQRYSGRINVDKTFGDNVKAGGNFYASRENSNYQKYDGNILSTNVMMRLLTFDPTVPVYNPDGTYGNVPGGRGDNPIAMLLEPTNETTVDKFNGTAFINYEIIKGLHAKVNTGIEVLQSTNGTYMPMTTNEGSQDNGNASKTIGKRTRSLFDATLTYMKELGEIHSLTAMVGYSFQKDIYETNISSAKGFSTDKYLYHNLGAGATQTVNSSKGENLLKSYFGRVNYSLKDRYLLTATFRADGSSRFGTNNQWGYFPSGSFAWRLIEEDFIQELDVFSNLKLRAGYGWTGNDRIGDYATFALMQNSKYTFDGSSVSIGMEPKVNSPENPNLKWETTKQLNVGLDFGFYNNRITASADYYYKRTDDLLISKPLQYATGFTTGVINGGEVENKGFEFSVNSENFVGAFKWNTNFNIAFNKNKAISLAGINEILIKTSKPNGSVSHSEYAILKEGLALGTLYGYKYIGVLKTGETYSPQPLSEPGDPLFEDVNGDGAITTDDRTILGDAAPDFIFGLGNDFSYKNFDLNIFFQGVVGNDVVNMNKIELERLRHRDVLNRWTPQNEDTDIPRNGFYNSPYGNYINSHFIEGGTYIRCKTVTLGYNLPVDKIPFFKKVRIYTTLENLFTITSYSGFDPEVDTKSYEEDGTGQTANLGGGLDFNSYPAMRTYTFGVNLRF